MSEQVAIGASECFGDMVLVGNHLRSASVTMRLDRERVDAYPRPG